MKSRLFTPDKSLQNGFLPSDLGKLHPQKELSGKKHGKFNFRKIDLSKIKLTQNETKEDDQKSNNDNKSMENLEPSAQITKDQNQAEIIANPVDQPQKSTSSEDQHQSSPNSENQTQKIPDSENPPQTTPNPENPPQKTPNPENPPQKTSNPENPPQKTPNPESQHHDNPSSEVEPQKSSNSEILPQKAPNSENPPQTKPNTGDQQTTKSEDRPTKITRYSTADFDDKDKSFNENLIHYFECRVINNNPISYSAETKKILAREINPIINPINSNLKTDLNISIKLIKYLRQTKLLDESISFIVKSFTDNISQEREMSIVHGFAYILSRITDDSVIKDKNLKLKFFKELQTRIPWLIIYKIFPQPDIPIASMNCLMGLIFYWLSYDPELVEFISIPIIENIIENNILDRFGYFVETFFNSTALIAFYSCPEKLEKIHDSLNKKLEELKSQSSPILVRLRMLSKTKFYPIPFSLQYTDITLQDFDQINDD